MTEKQVIPAEQKLGFHTAPKENPVTDTVATTPTKILNNNPDRIFALIVNLSLNRGWIGFSSQVASTRGIPIAGNGGFVSLNVEEDGELVIYEVWALNENASGTYYIVEVMRR